MSGWLFLLTVASPMTTITFSGQGCQPPVVAVVREGEHTQVVRGAGEGCTFRLPLAQAQLAGAWVRVAPCAAVKVPESWRGAPLPCEPSSQLVLGVSVPVERLPKPQWHLRLRPSQREMRELASQPGEVVPVEVLEVVAAGDGWRLGGLPRGAGVLLDVELGLAGYAPARLSGLRLLEGEVRRQVSLVPAGTLCGQLHPFQERPADEQLRVRITQDGQRVAEVPVGEDGRFCADRVPVGAPLTVWALGLYGESSPVVAFADGPPVTLTPPPLAKVRFFVRDGERREPVRQFQVTLRVGGSLPAGQPVPLALPTRQVIGKDGEAEVVRPLAALPASYTVQAEGYAPARGEVAPDQGEVEVLLARPQQVAGQVRDSHSGQGVAQAEVSVRCEGQLYQQTLTDGEGNFTLWVPAGARCTAEARKPGFCWQPPVSLPAEGQAATLTLEPAGVIQGQVVEADQRRPIASAKVRILGDGGPEVTTDASGAFTLAGLCHGFATLTVSAEGYTPLTLPVRRQDKVVVALRPSKVVKGRVLGLPPGRGAQLWVLGSTPWVVDVDETGGFFLGAGVPEEFSWIVRSPGFAPCSGRSRLPSQGELVLDCGGGNLTLRGRLVAPQAQGVKGRVLVLEGTEGEARRSHTTVGEDGSFAFTNLPAGTYRLITLMGQGVPLPVTLWQGSLSHDLRLELSLPAVPHPQAP